MIIDSSALLAVLRGEPEGAAFARAIESAAIRRISAANLLESAIVVDNVRDSIVSRSFDELIHEAQLVIEPVTEAQVHIAREAYRRFGKGRGNVAQLNFGDCFAYALSKDMAEPLLFKGGDFVQTDIVSAIRSTL